jgi:hypothetical protein
MASSLQYAIFAAQLNTVFRVFVDEADTIETELVEVSELKLSPRQERFAIVFRGPNDKFLGQGMRRFSHQQMGEFELFLVPISKDDQGTNYEAVFNRMPKND